MPQNEQDQQELNHLQQTDEQTEQESDFNPTAASIQAEQEPTAEQQKVEECLDRLLRTQADFVNYRRRMNQTLAEEQVVAQSTLLSQLLPVLDDLGRALEAAPPELAAHPWVQGLFLVARRLRTQLDLLGVRQIGASGEQFDPHRHEAVMTEASADEPEGTILHVVLPGYALGERVIRPAQVTVASAP